LCRKGEVAFGVKNGASLKNGTGAAIELGLMPTLRGLCQKGFFSCPAVSAVTSTTSKVYKKTTRQEAHRPFLLVSVMIMTTRAVSGWV